MSGHGRILSPIPIIVQMPEPDCFLRYRVSHVTRNFTPGKSDVYVLVAAARRGFKIILRPIAAATRGFIMVLFTEAVSRRNTFVGGRCAPPSALLVITIINNMWYVTWCAMLAPCPTTKCCMTPARIKEYESRATGRLL